jgi:Protein kinase domain
VLDPSSHRNPTIGRRFVLEGRAAASLDHPAIVPVYDAGDHDGLLWMAMRLVEGTSVDQALSSGRQFRPDEVLALVDRIGPALDHAHARGVVHRDVKPSNLLLEDGDPYRVHLADFGIAATARTAGRYTTGTLGTAAYMAPEQARPSEVGPPADFYALGCVVYEMVTGRRPFPGDDHVALLYAHATHAVPPTGNPAVDAVMARALAKSPTDRPPSGAALTHELRQALTPTDSTASSSTAPATDSAAPAPAAGAHLAAAEGDGRGRAGGQVDEYDGAAPTQVDHAGAAASDNPPATLVHPAPPGEPHHGGAHHPPVAGAAAAPRDPTMVRRGRRMARRRLAVGAVALLVAIGAVTVALLDRRGSSDRRVRDSAGISYELAAGWEVGTVEPPTTTLVRDGDVDVVTITHTGTAGADAADALSDAGSLCQGDPVVYGGIAGSTTAARCDNPQGSDPATVVGAIAGDQLWLITVAGGVAADERDAFLSSIQLQDA